MLTTFKSLCQSCGLTMSEATAFLDVREGTARAWWLGNRTCPQSVHDDLLNLYRIIDQAAQAAADFIMQQKNENVAAPEMIELGIASDDHEAQTLGFPCIGAHGAVLRRVIESLPDDLALRCIIVPRGATPATAAAIEAHGK